MTNLPLLPESVSVPTRILFPGRLPPNVAHTWIQLRFLAGANGVTPPLRMADLVTLTGKSQAALYTHLSMLKAVGEIDWQSAGSGVFIITFLIADQSDDTVSEEQSSPTRSPMPAKDRAATLTPPALQLDSQIQESTSSCGNRARSIQDSRLKVPENRSKIPHFEKDVAISRAPDSKIPDRSASRFLDPEKPKSRILDSSTTIPDSQKRDSQILESKNRPSSIKPPDLTDSQVLNSSSVDSWETHKDFQNHLDQRSNRIPPDRKNINLVGGGGKREFEGERGDQQIIRAIPSASGDPQRGGVSKNLQGASQPVMSPPQDTHHEAPVASDAQQIYATYTGLSLTPAQLSAINQKVRDLETWDNTLDHWLWHRWNPKNVTGMLELYARGGGSGCFFCTRGLHLKHSRYDRPDPQSPPHSPHSR